MKIFNKRYIELLHAMYYPINDEDNVCRTRFIWNYFNYDEPLCKYCQMCNIIKQRDYTMIQTRKIYNKVIKTLEDGEKNWTYLIITVSKGLNISIYTAMIYILNLRIKGIVLFFPYENIIRVSLKCKYEDLCHLVARTGLEHSYMYNFNSINI